MNRVLVSTILLLSWGFVACSNQPAATQPNAAAQATPSVSASIASPAVASAPTLAMPSPGTAAAPPIVPPGSKPGGKQAKVEQKPLPPDLWQRMTRPLTLEEINKLPPETRDMILRAQGRLPASPAPKQK